MPLPTQPEPKSSNLPNEDDEDYYLDGPYLVFTEAYHRKRGFCCQSGCRHCPFGFAGNRVQPLEVSEKEKP